MPPFGIIETFEMDVLQVMRAFRCVVHTGSLTAAAARLETTTANISRMLANLEAHLHIRLLNRTTRRIALTEAGKLYLERCEQILSLVEVAEDEVQQQHRRPVGQLRIHAMHGLGQSYVVDLINRYRQRYPQVTFNLTMSNHMPDLLEEGYDMSILLQDTPPVVSYGVKELGATHGILCASPDYLRVAGTPETPADLRQHACLGFCDPSRSADEWVLYGPRGSAHVSLVDSPLRVDSEEAMRSALTCALGIGMLPAYAAAPALRSGALVQVLTDYRSRRSGIYAVYPSAQRPDVRTSTWVDHLACHLPDLLAGDAALLCA